MDARTSRIISALQRVIADNAATPAEKEQAKAALERIRAKKVSSSINFDASKVSWDHGLWRKKKPVIRTYETTTMGDTSRVHVNFGNTSKKEATIKQYMFIKRICDHYGWQAPLGPFDLTMDEASEWLDYYSRRYYNGR